jgi:iron complex outermembrane receptor protein
MRPSTCRKMKNYSPPGFRIREGVILAAALALSIATSSALAQTTTATTDDISVSNTAPVKLSAFEVQAGDLGRYQSSDASSGGRVATDLFSSAETINVVTGELLADVGAERILDALIYTPSVTESTIPNGLDRITVRGFQVEGQTVDGFYIDETQSNIDTALIDHIEVVLGPNAILAPTGSPGGTINTITKKPSYQAQTTLSIEAGLFDYGGLVLDSTGPLAPDSKLAYRLVADVHDYDDYYDGTKDESYTIAPMLTYQFAQGTKLTVQALLDHAHFTNYLGLPVDPSSGSTNDASILAGLSRTASPYNDNDVYREQDEKSVSALFTSSITDNLSVRVAARFDNFFLHTNQETISGPSGGSIDPLTGLFTPGVAYGPGPSYTPSPAAQPNGTYSMGGAIEIFQFYTFDFQNDWVYKKEFAGGDSTTGAGYAYNHRWARGANPIYYEQGITGPTFNIFTQPYPSGYTIGDVEEADSPVTTTNELYANEVLRFWDKRISVSGGVSHVQSKSDDPVAIGNDEDTVIDASQDSYNYGIVFIPIPQLSLYADHSENASPVASNISPPGTPAFSIGKDDEIGVRVQLMDKRLSFALDHFEIKQTAYDIPNPGNLTVPVPNPLLPDLFSDRTAKGWEFQGSYQFTKEFSLIGNYSNFTNRDPNNVPFRDTAEKSGALMARYAFVDGALKGFFVTANVNYLGRRPGDAASGLTDASTSTDVIPEQPTYWIPERTLYNLSAGFTWNKMWTVQVFVDNIFDKKYIEASLNRNLVTPGPGTNLRGVITYRF